MFSLPAYVMEGAPHRPDVAVWIGPDGVRAAKIGGPPLGAAEFAASLRESIAAPMVGSSGRPSRVRIADATLAVAVRDVLGADVPIEIAATPEVDQLATAMAAGLGPPVDGGVERSYLEGGRIAPERVGEFFMAAAELWRAAPWKLLSDADTFAVDVPSLGIEDACLSVIGAAGQSFGFVLFASFGAYGAFVGAAEAFAEEHSPREALGGYLFSLSFESRRELTPTMRAELRAHRWPVAGPRAHPLIISIDPDGVPRPCDVATLDLAGACAAALARFATAHRSVLVASSAPPTRRAFLVRWGGSDVEVGLTYPHPEAVPDDEKGAPAPFAAAALGEPRRPSGGTGVFTGVGRNQPCPCGSGKKLKRCHGSSAAAEPYPPAAKPASEGPRPGLLHTVAARVLRDMFAFADREIGRAWHERLEVVRSMGEGAEGLGAPLLAFHASFSGRTVADRFAAAHSAKLRFEERDWLDAERRAWLSIWEVLAVVPSATVTVRDALTKEECTVDDVAASASACRGDWLLGRVVAFAGRHFFAGVHGRILQPSDAARVVAAVRKALGLRAKAVAPEHLRSERGVLAMIIAWQRAVVAATERFRGLQMRNADGDPILLTQDDFVFDPSLTPQVLERLATIAQRDEEAERDEGGGGKSAWTFSISRPAPPSALGLDEVTVGFLTVTPGRVRLETNSQRRADEHRLEVERVGAGLLRHRARVHADPRAQLDLPGKPAAKQRRGSSAAPPEAPPPEVQAAIRAHKERYYASWIDESIPALGGATPREAARDPSGRASLALLLADLEHAEERAPAAERFDVAKLRAELGVEL